MRSIALLRESGQNGVNEVTWTHFGCKPREWDKIDYLQIELTKDNSDLVFDVLRKIHVPGEEHDGIISIYGYRTDVDYLR